MFQPVEVKLECFVVTLTVVVKFVYRRNVEMAAVAAAAAVTARQVQNVASYSQN